MDERKRFRQEQSLVNGFTGEDVEADLEALERDLEDDDVSDEIMREEELGDE